MLNDFGSDSDEENFISQLKKKAKKQSMVEGYDRTGGGHNRSNLIGTGYAANSGHNSNRFVGVGGSGSKMTRFDN